jgi:hypothetical protein
MGINAITSVITNSFIVDMKYYQSIKDINMLSEFVDECIISGIPAKYISYNCYIMAHPSIRGNGSKGDKDNPIWGQSRVVFFPPNKDIVHKIALSQWGIRANKSEIEVSNKLSSVGNSKIIATVIDKTENRCIINAEKLNTETKIDPNVAKDFLNSVKNILKQNNIPLDITADVNYRTGHNLGIKDGKPAIIDYAISTRTSIGKAD